MVSGGAGAGEIQNLFYWNNVREEKPAPVFNDTLLRFAAVDLAEDSVGQNVEQLVDVGNSGILLKTNLGNAIDNHEFVIRLNNARTRGFERNETGKVLEAWAGSHDGSSFHYSSGMQRLCLHWGFARKRYRLFRISSSSLLLLYIDDTFCIHVTSDRMVKELKMLEVTLDLKKLVFLVVIRILLKNFVQGLCYDSSVIDLATGVLINDHARLENCSRDSSRNTG
ncbi:hypothetical protein L1987_86615 [Smallanthus sonchifolius]|uniref:Uncharacterized protein n=1 Tax=Smallanthus sonchifolius TaxID=185202 RepID=A0ACB8Y0N5_9ASTR|nr:hypothetical protein L1987_86615 [Smallanthus sonchifolius]